MAPHSSTLAWKIPWTEEPGGLQSMRSLRVGHDWATSLSLFTFMHWKRKWQPTPVFSPGESQGRGSVLGCHLWGRTESPFHIWYYTCFNAILPHHPTLSLSHGVQKTVLYISVSFAVSYVISVHNLSFILWTDKPKTFYKPITRLILSTLPSLGRALLNLSWLNRNIYIGLAK